MMSNCVRTGWQRTAGLSILACMLAAAGCGLLGFDWPTPATVEDLESAQEIALTRAQEWEDSARLVGLTCVWVDQDGLLAEPADGPGWAFQYVNEAGTLQIGVTVRPNGDVDASDPMPLSEPVTQTLSAHTTQDIEDYIDAAEAELLKAPEAKRPGTATVDIAVIVGFNQEDGSEDAVVLFHEEDDQGTDWANFNWFTLFQDADAYVFLNTADNAIETNSWEMSFERALRIARQSVADDSHLIGILAVWVDERGQLHEPADKPGWGFQFVNGDGTERIGVTVEADGKTIVSEPTILDTPITQELTDHAGSDIQDYVTVALAELANAPADKRPQTDTFDIAIIIGFNQQDGSEEASVLFHDEDDQQTDWANIDWFTLFLDAEAYVFLDTVTNNVENISWD